MKKKIWEARIPNGIALLLLLGGIFVSSYLIRNGIFIVSRAAPDTSPQNVTITNIADTSFTVSFMTQGKASAGIVIAGREGFGSMAPDDRDRASGVQNSYYSHEITITNLKPQTPYFFSIITNSTSYLNNGKQYAMKTGPTVPAGIIKYKPLAGKIITTDGTPGDDTLLYISIPGAQRISAVSKSNGEYIVPMNAVRRTDLSSLINLSDNTVIIIDATRQDSNSKISVLYKNSSSIPVINLENNYDFSQQVAQSSLIASPSGSLLLPPPQVKFGTVSIISPTDQESFIDQRPLFQGTSVPHEKVIITIHSGPAIQVSVISDQNGVWTFRPSTALSPGLHTITIQAADQFGNIRQVTRSFTVFASGSQLFQQGELISVTPGPTVTATPIPTATIQPTLSPTPTTAETPTPTIEGATSTPTETPIEGITPGATATPTATLAPTDTQIPLPTATPLPTKQYFPNTPTPTLAPTGNNSSVVMTGTSFFLIITGITLLFFL